MSQKIFVDSNVWLDYALQRKSTYLDLQEFAFAIFKRTLSCEFEIIVSDIVLFELKKYVSVDFLHEMKHKLLFINTSNKHKCLSKEIPIHYPDNLHVATAIIEGCSMMISNDIEMRSLDVNIPIISSQDL